jgi:hypothetical protein
MPGQAALVAPRADFKQKQKVKRQPAKSIPLALRTCDQFLCESIESAAQKAENGHCVVCNKVIEAGNSISHMEEHVKELWNYFEVADQEASVFDLRSLAALSLAALAALSLSLSCCSL